MSKFISLSLGRNENSDRILDRHFLLHFKFLFNY